VKLFVVIVSFVVLIPISISFYNDYQVFVNGSIVTVTISGDPICSSSRSVKMDFIYSGKKYDIWVGGNACRIFHSGEQIQLKYLEGFTPGFMFPNDNPLYSGFAMIAILLFIAIGGLYYLITGK